VIYELPYNEKGIQIENIRSVDNYIVIQYMKSVASLIAVEQE
jgi:hypothetical protein